MKKIDLFQVTFNIKCKCGNENSNKFISKSIKKNKTVVSHEVLCMICERIYIIKLSLLEKKIKEPLQCSE